MSTLQPLLETSTPTRTADTEDAYRKRVRKLITQCRRDLGVEPQYALDYRRLAGWLATRKTSWKADTFRQYRAATVFYLQQTDDPLAHEAAAALLEESSETCLTHSRRSSSAKLKRLPQTDLHRILGWLDKHSAVWGEDLRNWLTTGLLTGLRPSEWAHTSLLTLKGEPALRIKNGKDSNGRANGSYRTQLLGHLTKEEMTGIRYMVDRGTAFEAADEYSRFQGGCASLLTRIVRQIWPRRTLHLCLYSARHQFSADAKASGFLPEEVAALMGHGVDFTAIKHYGRRAVGESPVRVRPLRSEVETVRLSATLHGPEPGATVELGQTALPHPEPHGEG